jgi:hypothetical protein
MSKWACPGLLVITVVLAFGRAGPCEENPLSSLRCTSFEWQQVPGLSDKAAIIIPVVLNGCKRRFQLDTGADVSLLYAAEAKAQGRRPGDRTVRVRDVEIGGLKLGSVRMGVREDKTSEEDMAGTIGLDVLIGRSTIIDFVRRRFCLLDPNDVPATLVDRAAWTDGEIRDGKFFVRTTLDGHPLEGVVWDSGSSALALVVDQEDWRRFTGRCDESEATSRLSGHSWGNTVAGIGAPATGDLEIAGVRLSAPLVYYIREAPTMFHDWPFPARGLLGNVPFLGRVVILELTQRPRLGSFAP